jgi:hypothetical protein
MREGIDWLSGTLLQVEIYSDWSCKKKLSFVASRSSGNKQSLISIA